MFSSQRRFAHSLDLEDGGAMKSSLHKPDTAGSRNLRNIVVVVLVVLGLFFFVPGSGLSLTGSVRRVAGGVGAAPRRARLRRIL